MARLWIYLFSLLAICQVGLALAPLYLPVAKTCATNGQLCTRYVSASASMDEVGTTCAGTAQDPCPGLSAPTFENLTSGDVVCFMSGTYLPVSGELTVPTGVTLCSLDYHGVTISGSAVKSWTQPLFAALGGTSNDTSLSPPSFLGFYFTSFTYPATGFSLFSWSNASLFISNSTITDINNAGGWVVQCLNFARCSVHDTLFEDIIGGSVLATQNATLVLHDTKIKSNKGDHLGASAGEITNSKFTSNIDSTVTDPTSCGGAIHLEECDLVLLTNMTFISNRAFNGGALCSVRTDIITSNMTFDNNWAVRDCGGALAFPAGWPVAIEFYDSVFINNAANRYGGGLCADYAIISNAQFYYNRAGKGGGYYAPLVDTVSNATFAYNYASEAGGAMYLGTEGNSIGGIETSVFENNTSDGSGGCIYVEDDVFVAATVFRNCKSEGFGGGIFIGGTSEQSAQVDLDHVLFENNVAVSGGAVFVGGVLTKTDIRDATFVNNYAIVNGGAVHIYSPFSLEDPLVMQRCTFTGSSLENDNFGVDISIDSSRASIRESIISSISLTDHKVCKSLRAHAVFNDVTFMDEGSDKAWLTLEAAGTSVILRNCKVISNDSSISPNWSDTTTTVRTCELGYRAKNKNQTETFDCVPCQPDQYNLEGGRGKCLACPTQSPCAEPSIDGAIYNIIRGFAPSPPIHAPKRIVQCPSRLAIKLTEDQPTSHDDDGHGSHGGFAPSGELPSLTPSELLNIPPFDSGGDRVSFRDQRRSDHGDSHDDSDDEETDHVHREPLQPSPCLPVKCRQICRPVHGNDTSAICFVECDELECVEGYEGRLCSKCTCDADKCWYQGKKTCYPCKNVQQLWPTFFILSISVVVFIVFRRLLLKILFVIILIVVLLLVVLRVGDRFLMTWLYLAFLIFLEKVKTSSEGVLKSLVFYVQTTAAIVSANVWPRQIRIILEYLQLTEFSGWGLECLSAQVFGEPLPRAIFNLVLPLVLIATLFIVQSSQRLLRRIPACKSLQEYNPMKALKKLACCKKKANVVNINKVAEAEEPLLQESDAEDSTSESENSEDDGEIGDTDFDESYHFQEPLPTSTGPRLGSASDRNTTGDENELSSMTSFAFLDDGPSKPKKHGHGHGHGHHGKLKKRTFIEGLTHGALFFFFVCHFELCMFAFEILEPCQHFEGEGWFSPSLPWLECTPGLDTQYGKMRLMALTLGLFYVVGLLLMFGFLLFRFRARIRQGDEKLEKLIGFLYESYRPRYYWFELVWFIRRILLAAAIALLNDLGALYPVVVSLILLVSLLIQRHVKPFNSKLENFMEQVAIAAILFTAICTQSIVEDLEHGHINESEIDALSFVQWLLFVANMGAIALFGAAFFKDKLKLPSKCPRLFCFKKHD